MLERDIVSGILRYLKGLPHCFAWKTHGNGFSQAGIPDIIACVSGRFIALEVKQPGGKLTKLQEITLGRINAAKGSAFMVTSAAEVRQIILELQEGLPDA